MVVKNEVMISLTLTEQEAKAFYKELDTQCEFSDEDCPVLYEFYKELEDVIE